VVGVFFEELIAWIIIRRNMTLSLLEQAMPAVKLLSLLREWGVTS
jgi:hypothetical protein